MFESVGQRAPVHRRRRAGALLMSTLLAVSFGSVAALSGEQLVEDAGGALDAFEWAPLELPALESPPQVSGGGSPVAEVEPPEDEVEPPEDDPAPPDDEIDPPDDAVEPPVDEPGDAVAALDPPEDGLSGGGGGTGPGSGPGVGPGDCAGGPCDQGPPGTGQVSGDGAAVHWSELSFKLQKKPRFPETAKRMGLDEETCIVKVYFGADGRYYNHAIQDCHHAFHYEIERVLPRWQIRPYEINGEPSPTMAVVPITFRLR